jgi:hypothetical protein
MSRKSWVVALVMVLAPTAADAQVVSGVMGVTQTHMS